VNVSIDDDAQRQLLAAAAQIEALAAQLRESRKNIVHDPSLAPGAISVDEAIMEAAIAISQATHMLVNAAAAAQKERVEKGRAQATAARPYVANAVWAEGLLSAGRAVAMATSNLTSVANEAARTKGMGEMIEEGLIAASHGVASSTAQLVAATRSKSDASSPTQAKVEEAAKALVSWQNLKCGGSGFVTGLPGLALLPVTLTADTLSNVTFNIQTIIAVALLGGFDVRNETIKLLALATLIGESVEKIIRPTGITVAQVLSKAMINAIPRQLLGKINKAVGVKLFTKFSAKGIIQLGKAVPIIGAFFCAGIDYYASNLVGKNAIETFIRNHPRNE